ncbi:aspartic peptidase domain-containing protein [Suillus spraguei]|nr:aspartic peptidase domain-containing protein [Suillus spraguei]
MFLAVLLLTTFLLVLSIVASPVEIRNSLPISRRLNTFGGYIAAVGVGSHVATYNFIVDTGSSNTWVDTSTPYVKTSTSVDTDEAVSVTYGSGSFSGAEYIDTVTLGSGLTITEQLIDIASTSVGLTGVDGILGIGPLGLTDGNLTDSSHTTVPTVTDNLPPLRRQTPMLTFGGTDTSDLTYTPLTTTEPAFYQRHSINESITYGTTTILAETSGIVDTGTTLILIATNAYSKYISATGANEAQMTSLLRITPTKYNDLNFKVGSNTYALTPNGQIWPRVLHTSIGGCTDYIYLILNSIDFINSYTFLERFYSVFDTTNSRIGLATSAYTTATHQLMQLFWLRIEYLSAMI